MLLKINSGAKISGMRPTKADTSKKIRKQKSVVCQMIAEILHLSIVVQLSLGPLSHQVAQRSGRFHTEMVAIEGQFLNQFVVDHHVERHPAAFLAQALQRLQGMDG